MTAGRREDDISIAIRGPLRSANLEKPIEGFGRDVQSPDSVLAQIERSRTCAKGFGVPVKQGLNRVLIQRSLIRGCGRARMLPVAER
jgi:hypothetical protein